MFTPKYTITHRLLANIKRVTNLISELNQQRFSKLVLLEFERTAQAVSSYASTSIEGNPLPLTEVKKLLKSQPTALRDSELEVINYNRALQNLDKLISHSPGPHLNLKLILSIHKQVMDKLLAPHESGKLRTHPVVVNDPKTGNTVYLPPEMSEVPTLMQDLLTFIESNTTTVDPLILAGIFHKQMVIIHPFIDGNGRTTRLGTKILLAQMGLNTFKLFSFESYYNQNVTKYFQIVGEYGNYYDLFANVDFTHWLEYFTGGIIDELLRVQKLIPNNSIYPQDLQTYHLAILDFIKTKGLIRQSDYAQLVNRAKPTRSQDFKVLVKLGLIEKKGQARSTYYVLK